MMKSFKDDVFFQNFEKLGKEMYGQKYILHENEAQILLKLRAYFGKDVKAAQELDIDLQKGIFLTGSIGSGKTSLMHIFRESLLPNFRFLIKPCADVSFEYVQDGVQVIFQYSRKSFKNDNQPRTICFDDLGLEPSTSFYSNKVNIMREIILSRYYFFKSHDMITHFTSNLGASELEKRYGKEVRSRVREMCNIIVFPQNTEDKRS